MAAQTAPMAIIYNELIDFCANYVERVNVFLGRPKTVDKELKQFLVIELPAEIHDIVSGNKDFALNTTGIIYVFNRAKSNATMNLNSQSTLTYNIKKGFPYVGAHIRAVRPTILHQGFDGNDFHITTITFKLKTKPNAFIQSNN